MRSTAEGVPCISADVALGTDGSALEPVVGSFAVEGLTYAIVGEGAVRLVGASSPGPLLAVPAAVSHEGADYAVAAIGAYAFAGCQAATVSLPATVADVDLRAFRSTAVQRIVVAPPNPTFLSFDGALYRADPTSLLLIPGGRAGTVRILSQTEVVAPGALSHCAQVTSIDADADGAAFRSWDGLLYTADGTTLVAVPAGAAEIAIREGCTTLAPGALAGCTQLRAVHAPGSVTSVSPDAFTVEPAAVSGSSPAQLTSLVALSATADDLPKVDPEGIVASLAAGADPAPWEAAGFTVQAADATPDASALPEEPASVDGLAQDAGEGAPAESLGDLLAEGEGEGAAQGGEAAQADGTVPADDPAPGANPADDPAVPLIANQVARSYGYANERSMGSYERATPKIDAVLRLQPITAEELEAAEADVGGDGSAAGSGQAPGADGDLGDAGADAEGALPATRLADLPEDSLAAASFLYEGCLYALEPEEGCAALVAVDRKRLAECAEDPATLVLPGYVADGQRAYRLTRIAKGALAGSGVERLWIPASATYLDYALEGCETLRYVEISEDSPVYSSKGGCLYDKSGETLWMAPEALPALLPPEGAEGASESAAAAGMPPAFEPGDDGEAARSARLAVEADRDALASAADRASQDPDRAPVAALAAAQAQRAASHVLTIQWPSGDDVAGWYQHYLIDGREYSDTYGTSYQWDLTVCPHTHTHDGTE